MDFVFSLIEHSSPGLIWPSYLIGWLGLAAMFALLIWAVRRWWEPLYVSANAGGWRLPC
jgi:hypothetical protein